ncbi:MAG TPA: aromatic amino acid ammonia-lyase, partial [Kineosporiaceae bacterium]|nr:aromatic amino acid ammonia-lyase [Kineosporiaceae bacterium]
MLTLDGRHLTCDAVTAVAAGGVAVQVAPSARARAAASWAVATRAAGSRPVYGRTTGVGANSVLPVIHPQTHAIALLRSHATSTGPPRSAERVRAMLLVRLNQLAAGGSGAGPELLDALAAMLTADRLPTVREGGGIGTGDLAALASVGLALAGETSEPGLLPTLGVHEALPLISSNAATIADAALAYAQFADLVRASVAAAALTFVVVRGNREAYSEAVEHVTPFDGARVVCRWLRGLTEGSPPPSRLQDPFSLRVVPQSVGPAVDALEHLRHVVEALANAPSENPVLLPGPPDGGWAGVAADGAVAHHGGFHAVYLGTALDAATLAVTASAVLSVGRLHALVEPEYTGLTPFLADPATPGSSGVMMLEYLAADSLARMRAAAAPASLQSASVSRGVENAASFAPLAASNATAAAAGYRTVLSCELLAARRALVQQGVTVPAGVAAVLAELDVQGALAALGDEAADRDLSPDLD